MSGEEVIFDPSFRDKFFERLDRVRDQLSEDSVFQDQRAFVELSKEHSRLVEITNSFQECDKLDLETKSVKQLLDSSSSDEEMNNFLEEELQGLLKKREEFVRLLEFLLVPPDPLDDLNTIVEIRAGTGGDEAALFVSDCARMYQLYASEKKWKLEVLAATPSSLGGFKEYIFEASGKSVYRTLRHEAGTHRVQRVPVTETQGRLHTSAVTIAVLLPDDPSAQKLEIDEKEGSKMTSSPDM
ncbi:PCRF domain-containing protein [Candidatus Similichlamydia epinepheli]|uniref:PCRF domain-containing protein n=1 Tax=Candidatus Similichlamydia epinepheli TaxID=1903953 RepID=UPI000D3C7531|nr:PCRF domain-containing protein [Candidatus Similichlamydia epinepheli]